MRHQNGDRGGTETAGRARADNAVLTEHIHRDGRIGAAVAPLVAVRARGGEHRAAAGADGGAACDNHFRKRVHRNRGGSRGGATLRIRNRNGIEAAHGSGVGVRRGAVLPQVTHAARSVQRGGLPFAHRGDARDVRSRQRQDGQLQSDGGVAPVSRGEGLGVLAGCGVGGLVPRIGATAFSCGIGVLRFVDD